MQAFTTAENHYGIHKLLKPSEMDKPDRLALFTYLSNFYAVFKELDLPEEAPATSIKKTPPSKPPRRSSQGRSPHYQKILMTPPSTERSWTTRTSTTRRNFRSIKRDKRKEKEAKKEASVTTTETAPIPELQKSNIKKLSPSEKEEKNKKQASGTPVKSSNTSLTSSNSSINSSKSTTPVRPQQKVMQSGLISYSIGADSFDKYC